MFAAKEAEAFLAGLDRPEEVQERTLLEKIVRPNVDSDFGCRHGFAQIHSVADYRARVPIAGYESFRPAVERILAGEEGVLTAEPVRRFFLTSGSTAQPKYIPVTSSFTRDKSRAFGIYWSLVYRDHPGVQRGNMVTNFSDSGEMGRAPNGLPASSESAYWASVTAATMQKARPLIPRSVTRIGDTELRYYTILRILLAERFAALMSLNPSTIQRLFALLAEERQALLQDLELGGMRRALPDEAAAHVQATYPPDPARAAELRAQGELLAHRVWPALELVASWRSPMLAPYLRMLEPHLVGVAQRDYISMASEGVMSIPVRSGQTGGVLATGVHFYEFVPEDQAGQPAPSVLGPEELELDRSYLVLLSTSGGLYRYNIGDVVKVVGFEGRTPITSFLYRAGNTCSLTGEKLTEDQVTAAVSRVATELGLELVSFTAQPAPTGFPRYAFLVELARPAPAERLAAFPAAVDRALAELNMEYASKRTSRRLAAPELWRVRPGSYALRHERRVREGANDSQLKPVHLTRRMDFAGELAVEEKFGAAP